MGFFSKITGAVKKIAGNDAASIEVRKIEPVITKPIKKLDAPTTFPLMRSHIKDQQSAAHVSGIDSNPSISFTLEMFTESEI